MQRVSRLRFEDIWGTEKALGTIDRRQPSTFRSDPVSNTKGFHSWELRPETKPQKVQGPFLALADQEDETHGRAFNVFRRLFRTL